MEFQLESGDIPGGLEKSLGKDFCKSIICLISERVLNMTIEEFSKINGDMVWLGKLG